VSASRDKEEDRRQSMPTYALSQRRRVNTRISIFSSQLGNRGIAQFALSNNSPSKKS
jgi:hypothetical protein